jgi:plastocyanin
MGTRIGRTARAAAAAVLAASLGGCALWGIEGGPGGAGIAAPATSSPPAGVAAEVGSDGIQRVRVDVDDELRFVPMVVRARPGIVEFTFRNAGSTPHDVQLPGPDGNPAVATGNLNGGQESTVVVTIERPGRYPFPCLYHASSGMQGTLEVV